MLLNFFFLKGNSIENKSQESSNMLAIPQISTPRDAWWSVNNLTYSQINQLIMTRNKKHFDNLLYKFLWIIFVLWENFFIILIKMWIKKKKKNFKCFYLVTKNSFKIHKFLNFTEFLISKFKKLLKWFKLTMFISSQSQLFIKMMIIKLHRMNKLMFNQLIRTVIITFLWMFIYKMIIKH